jgi:large subunit ribosomal protein L9
MKVILKEKIETLGNVGEIVNVSSGHARNFLFPRKLAVVADKNSKKMIDEELKRLKKKIEEELKEAKAVASKISKVKMELFRKAGANGKLFGSITTKEISEALSSNEDLKVEKRLLTLQIPIKQLGSYQVKAKLYQDVNAEFTVQVSMDPKHAEVLKKQAIQKEKDKKDAKARQAELEKEKVEEAKEA